MVRKLGIILGIGALVTTSTGAVASPVTETSNQVIIQGGKRYLYNIENRSIATDFDDFFQENSQTTTLNNPEGIIESPSQSQTETEFLDNIRVEIGDDSPNEAFDIFPNSRTGDRSDNSQILYEFEQW